MFADVASVLPADLGTVVICLFVLIQGGYYIKQLVSKPKEPHKSYSDQFVTRVELNGKLDKLNQNIEKVINKLDQSVESMEGKVNAIGADVTALKMITNRTNYWRS